MKKTYYISLARGEISQISTASPWNYKIEATDEEIVQLREYFDQIYSSDWQGFFRAHTPYIEYHHDPTNDAYDETIQKVYGLIYELGDEETREHIDQEGILKD
ncbi:hydrolase [Bacillus salitolerans]|uniref:Hydrolase n=1 Tax=Bacillus salitolerans TaxID=1437434 RepID=A0ABW4LW14_9BACI